MFNEFLRRFRAQKRPEVEVRRQSTVSIRQHVNCVDTFALRQKVLKLKLENTLLPLM